MSDPAILFVKPRAIKAADKRALRGAGVIVVEVEDPSAVKFTRAAVELTSTQLLVAAVQAIEEDSTGYARSAFGRLVIAMLCKPGSERGAA